MRYAALRLLPFLSLYKFDKFYMSELPLNFLPNETLDKLTTFALLSTFTTQL